MSIKNVREILINASRPIDVFGSGSIDEIKKKYRELAKMTHPDLASEEDYDIALSTTMLLNELYESALKEIDDGTYYLTELKDIYKTKESLFDISIRNKKYTFYDAIKNGDISVCYYGLSGEDEEVILKHVLDINDNELIKKEHDLLNRLDHISIPKVIKKVSIDGHDSILMPYVSGLTLDDVIKRYYPIEDRHLAWILERMLSSIGYLHYNKIVHGNIKPENLVLNVDTHNVTLLDYSFSIDASISGAKYLIYNDDYSLKSILGGEEVKPYADIYSVGKIAVELLGGDIKSNGMPINSNIYLRRFIRKIIENENNDAWTLWDELIKLRNDEFGSERFQKLELKRK